MRISRRLFLRSGAQALSAASLLSAVPGLALAKDQGQKAGASAADMSVKDVSGLAVFAGSGCNVVALSGPDGALLVDGGLAVNSAVLLKFLDSNLKTSRVQTLINTHWHPEQTGSQRRRRDSRRHSHLACGEPPRPGSQGAVCVVRRLLRAIAAQGPTDADHLQHRHADVCR